MIYTSHPDVVDEVHLFLKEDVEVVGKNHDKTNIYGSDEGALCGEEVNRNLTPGGLTWADNILDLLNTDGVCEECRTRAGVYLGLIEDVEVWARTVATDQCGKHEDPVPAEYVIEGVKGHGIVVRRAVCPECDREITRDEVTIPDADRGPLNRR